MLYGSSSDKVKVKVDLQVPKVGPYAVQTHLSFTLYWAFAFCYIAQEAESLFIIISTAHKMCFYSP